MMAGMLGSRWRAGGGPHAGMLCTISAAREVGHEAADLPIHIFGPPGLASFLEAAMELSDTYLLVPVVVHEFVAQVVPGRSQDHQVRASPRILEP